MGRIWRLNTAVILSLFIVGETSWGQFNPDGNPVNTRDVPSVSPVGEGRSVFSLTSPSDPGTEFDLARNSFLQLDAKEAAARIRRGMAIMREKSSDATAAGRHAIDGSLKELETLAKSVETRAANSVHRLDDTFARAHMAMAEHHYLRAMQEREVQARHRVGEDLRIAAEQFQRSVERTGVVLRKDEKVVVDRTKALASKLSGGMESTSEEIGREMRNFGKNMASVRDRMLGTP